MQGLEIGERNDHQQANNHQPDWPGHVQPGGSCDNQSQVDFLVGIGDGRKRVRREGCQGADLVQFLVRRLLRGQWWTDEEFTDAVYHSVWIVSLSNHSGVPASKQTAPIFPCGG